MSKGRAPRRIVVAMDGSQNAEDAFTWYLKKLSQKNDYVIVLHVPECKKLTHVPVMTSDVALMKKMVDEEQQQTKLMLAKMNELMKMSGVNGNIKQLNGEPGEEIVKAANKEGADFIVTGSRGLGKLKRAFLGSVSDYIVHHATVPVLVCRLEDSLY